jgi:hypothetical protein
MIPSRMCDACPSCMRRFPGAAAEGFVLFSLRPFAVSFAQFAVKRFGLAH